MTTTVQNYLDKGLRGLWYPVLASWEVQVCAGRHYPSRRADRGLAE